MAKRITDVLLIKTFLRDAIKHWRKPASRNTDETPRRRKHRHKGHGIILPWRHIKPTPHYHMLQRGFQNKLRLWKAFSLTICFAPGHMQTEEPESCPGSEKGHVTQLIQASQSPFVKQAVGAWESLQLSLPGLSAPLPFYSISSCVLKAFIVRLPDTEPSKYRIYIGKNDLSYLLAEFALTWGTEQETEFPKPNTCEDAQKTDLRVCRDDNTL